MRSRELGITLVLSVIVAVALLGWLDALEAVLNRVSLVPGKSQFSLWALLKGLVVVTAFVLVASLIARAIERHVMRLESAGGLHPRRHLEVHLLLAGRPGRAARHQCRRRRSDRPHGADRRHRPGAGLRPAVHRQQFRQRLRAAHGQSIKPGDVISFSGQSGTSTENFGWVQELRGRYVVVRDRDGVEMLVPNQQLISNAVINWSYTDPRIRLKLPIRVSYRDDPELALELLLEACEGQTRVLREPAPVSRLMHFGDSGIELELRFWISDPQERA